MLDEVLMEERGLGEAAAEAGTERGRETEVPGEEEDEVEEVVVGTGSSRCKVIQKGKGGGNEGVGQDKARQAERFRSSWLPFQNHAFARLDNPLPSLLPFLAPALPPVLPPVLPPYLDAQELL